MRQLIWTGIGLISVFAVPLPSMLGQELRGPGPEQIFRYLDRNNNGRIDREEIERSPFRSRFDQMEINYRRGFSKKEFERTFSTMRAAREREYREAQYRQRSSYEEQRGRSYVVQTWVDPNSRGRGERPRYEFRGPNSRSSNGTTTSRSVRKPREKIRVTMALQEPFQEGDHDQDGQIGFYEWRLWRGRASAGEFALLDKNHDGFVTPQEIAWAGEVANEVLTAKSEAKPAASEETSAQQSQATSPAESSSPPSETTAKPSESAGSTSSATQVAPAAVQRTPPDAQKLASIEIDEENSDVRRFRNYFSILDRDRDGSLSPQEWDRSRKIRKRLEEAGIDLSKPMDGDTFVRYNLWIEQQPAS